MASDISLDSPDVQALLDSLLDLESEKPPSDKCDLFNECNLRMDSLVKEIPFFELKDYLEESSEPERVVRRYECPTCGKTYARVDGRGRHIKSAHSSIKFKCEKCNKFYGRQDNLKKHVRTCPNRRRIVLGELSQKVSRVYLLVPRESRFVPRDPRLVPQALRLVPQVPSE
jgi:hypothetical protein